MVGDDNDAGSKKKLEIVNFTYPPHTMDDCVLPFWRGKKMTSIRWQTIWVNAYGYLWYKGDLPEVVAAQRAFLDGGK